jgi:hypothetical protein
MGNYKIWISDAATDFYISSDIVGPNSETARFRSRNGGCSSAFKNIPNGCQVDITYSYTDINSISGIANVSIAGNSQAVTDTPTGDTLVSVSIDSVSWFGGSCGSNNLYAC